MVLGKNGAEKIIEMELDSDTKKKIDEAATSIKESINILKDEGFFS